MTLNSAMKLTPVSLRLCLLLLFSTSFPLQAGNELPSIGNSSSSMISIEQERRLGQAWLRSLRAHVKLFDNAIVEEYIRHTLYTLAPNSHVEDRNFSIIVINSPELNAFAVPGSIVGVNAGLFLHAVSEHEFASVLAHELAHLSQRHYARQLEMQKKDAPLTLAGMLASIVIGATAGSDAGMAALATTQALSVDKQLSFSRQNEQEADRLGIEVLASSGYDPQAMPVLFERMFRQNRMQGERIPEYLSTHPLSDTRINDTQNRAAQYPPQNFQESLEYHICKHIVYAELAENDSRAIAQFESILKFGNTIQMDAARFGLAYAYLKTEPSKSLALLKELKDRYPTQISLGVTYARALAAANSMPEGIDELEKMLNRNPDNYPIASTLVDLYMEANRIQDAEKTLKLLTRKYPDNAQLWYKLAEANGLAGNIVDLHISRAEYFTLVNSLDSAIEQLRLAAAKSQNQSLILARINRRIQEVEQIKKDSPF